MSELEFVPLASVPEEELVALMSHPRVAAYLPLLSGGFTLEACRAFVHAKQTMWLEHGYGPWAFRVDGELAGWGGLPEHPGHHAAGLHPRRRGDGGRAALPALSALSPLTTTTATSRSAMGCGGR